MIATLEPDIQAKIVDEQMKSKQIVTLNNNVMSFAAEKAKLEALARIDIVQSLLSFRKKYKIQKEADFDFLSLYNSGQFLPKIYKTIGSISRSTLYRWVRAYSENETTEALMPKYKYSKMGESKTTLTPEMISVFKGFLLNENQFRVSKAICFTKVSLLNRGITDLPSDMTFRRYAEEFKKLKYGEWVLRRNSQKDFFLNFKKNLKNL